MDSLNYMDSYDELPDFSVIDKDYFAISTYQPLYILLCSLAKSIHEDFTILQILHSIIINSIVFIFIKNNTKYWFTGLFLYLISYFLYFNTEILRESLAVGVFLINLENYRSQKWRNYYIGAVISLLFHYSAIIVFIFPLLHKLKFNYFFFFLILCWIIFLPSVSSLILSLDFSSSLTALYYTIQRYGELNELNINYRLRAFLYISAAPSLLLWYSKRFFKDRCKDENLICIYVLIGISCFFYPMVFERFSNYIWPIVMLCVANAIIVGIKNRRGKLVVSVIFIMFSILSISRYFEYPKWIPYKSVFDKEKVPIRETIRNNRFA